MDLTGQKIGRLTIISRLPEDYITPSTGQRVPRWLCKCDCGVEKIILQNSLTCKRPAQSCGCLQREKATAAGHDLAGKKIGRLTVLHKTKLHAPQGNGVKNGWYCRCECGTEGIYTQKDLMHSSIKSCGCLLSETGKKKLGENNVLGRFDGTVISKLRPGLPPTKNNKSGHRGVYFSKREMRWIAKIMLRGKSITIGRFKNLADAVAARKEAEAKYFGPIIEAYESY